MTITKRQTQSAGLSARKLQLCPVTFLNQLYRLGEFSMIVRADGAALLQKTRFGIFLKRDDGSFFDPVSNLRIVPEMIERICLITEPGSPPFFEIEVLDGGFSLAILPSGKEADLERIECFCRTCLQEELSMAGLQQLGAGAWLDEKLSANTRTHWKNDFVVSDGDHSFLQAKLESAAISVSCHLSISACDHDEDVWHFSDTSSASVIYLDLSHPGIALRGFSPVYRSRQSIPIFPSFDLN